MQNAKILFYLALQTKNARLINNDQYATTPSKQYR